MWVRNSDGGVEPKACVEVTGTERKVMADTVENTRAEIAASLLELKYPRTSPSVWDSLGKPEKSLEEPKVRPRSLPTKVNVWMGNKGLKGPPAAPIHTLTLPMLLTRVLN